VSKSPVLASLAGLALSALLTGCGSFLAAAADHGSGGAGATPGSVVSGAPSASALPYDVSGLLDPPAGKFLGVETPGAPGSLAPVARFAASVGKRPDIIGQYVAWNSPFAPESVAQAWSYGALS
jgi:hypothetical protein